MCLLLWSLCALSCRRLENSLIIPVLALGNFVVSKLMSGSGGRQAWLLLSQHLSTAQADFSFCECHHVSPILGVVLFTFCSGIFRWFIILRRCRHAPRNDGHKPWKEQRQHGVSSSRSSDPWLRTSVDFCRATHSVCPSLLPHAWQCLRSGWMWLWAIWFGGRCPYLWQEGWK